MNTVQAKSQKRILIVDDDFNNSDVIQLMLKCGGISDVHIEKSGKTALDYLGVPAQGCFSTKNQAVDIVILDVVLPDISGFDVCSRIKQVFRSSLPVMLITGFNVQEYISRGVEVGADDFLSKPITKDELLMRVNILLRKNELHKKINKKPLKSDNSSSLHYPTTILPEEGRKIGNYVIIKMVSWSSSSVIYLVRSVTSRKKFILKRILKQVLKFPEVIHRFKREIKLMQSFDHPNICTLYNYDEIDECPYCVMEYLEGDNLESLVKKKRLLDFPTIFHIAIGVAKGLKCIHEKKVIHRDIKLNNIFLCKDRSVKICDFGVAIQEGDARLTQHGYVIGTPVYMAPEQFDGAILSPATDIYSYGASLYHLISGSSPFTAETVMQLIHKHHKEKPKPLEGIRKDTSPLWDDLVSKCLEKKIEDRPQSMEEILLFLNQYSSSLCASFSLSKEKIASED